MTKIQIKVIDELGKINFLNPLMEYELTGMFDAVNFKIREQGIKIIVELKSEVLNVYHFKKGEKLIIEFL